MRIATLFKKDISEIERLFSDTSVKIRGNLDFNTAERYQRLIQRAGLICHIEEDKITENKTLEMVQKPVEHRDRCPNCQAELASPITESPHQECLVCGIIISKFKQKEKGVIEKRGSNTTRDQKITVWDIIIAISASKIFLTLLVVSLGTIIIWHAFIDNDEKKAASETHIEPLISYPHSLKGRWKGSAGQLVFDMNIGEKNNLLYAGYTNRDGDKTLSASWQTNEGIFFYRETPKEYLEAHRNGRYFSIYYSKFEPDEMRISFQSDDFFLSPSHYNLEFETIPDSKDIRVKLTLEFVMAGRVQSQPGTLEEFKPNYWLFEDRCGFRSTMKAQYIPRGMKLETKLSGCTRFPIPFGNGHELHKWVGVSVMNAEMPVSVVQPEKGHKYAEFGNIGYEAFVVLESKRVVERIEFIFSGAAIKAVVYGVEIDLKKTEG